MSLPDVQITVPSDVSSPVTIQDTSAEAVSIHRPYDSESDKAEALGDGTVANEGETFSAITSVYVMVEGLRDLREYHPRSMGSVTMAQQWECHVVGLPGTINIDLESYRRSWPSWRSGIFAALIKRSPASACNW